MRRALVAALIVLALPFPAAAQTPQPKIAIVVDLNIPEGRPLLTVTGRPSGTARDVPSFDSALKHLDAKIPYAITMTGVMCDELRLLGTPAARAALTTIRRIAAAHSVLASTYSGTPLSSVDLGDIGKEIRDGRDSVARCVPSVGDIFVPPLGALPTRAIVKAVSTAGVRTALSTFAVPSSDPRPKILPASTVTCDHDACSADRPEADVPIAIVTLADAGHDIPRLAGDKAAEVVGVTSVKEDVIEGLIAEVVRPPASRVKAIEVMEAAVKRFRSFTLAGNRLAAVYKTLLARARCCGTATQPVRRAVDEQLGSVAVSASGITFTSRRGSVPITVSDHAPYRVRVRITISSPKLSFPGGRSRIITVAPPGSTTTFEALARSSGTFPLTVQVATPDGGIPIATAVVSVRSAAVNLPAVVLTLGGLVVFVAWAARRARRRRHPQAGP